MWTRWCHGARRLRHAVSGDLRHGVYDYPGGARSLRAIMSHGLFNGCQGMPAGQKYGSERRARPQRLQCATPVKVALATMSERRAAEKEREGCSSVGVAIVCWVSRGGQPCVGTCNSGPAIPVRSAKQLFSCAPDGQAVLRDCNIHGSLHGSLEETPSSISLRRSSEKLAYRSVAIAEGSAQHAKTSVGWGMEKAGRRGQ